MIYPPKDGGGIWQFDVNETDIQKLTEEEQKYDQSHKQVKLRWEVFKTLTWAPWFYLMMFFPANFLESLNCDFIEKKTFLIF